MIARLFLALLCLGFGATTATAQVATVPQAVIPSLPTGGFVPGGQSMAGQTMTPEQYMRARYLQSLSGRSGSRGPQRGFDQFAQQQMLQQQAALQEAAAAAQAQQSTPVAKSVKVLPGTKLTEEERRARVNARAAEQKAKIQQSLEQKRREAKQQGG